MSFLFSFMPYQQAWKLLVPGCALRGWKHVVCVVGVTDTPMPAVCQKYTLMSCRVVLTKERTMSWCCKLLGKVFPFLLMLSLFTLNICILHALIQSVFVVVIICGHHLKPWIERNLWLAFLMRKKTSHILDHGFMMVIKFFSNYVYLIFLNYLS